MESLKNTVNFYVNSNLHVALACLCMVEVTKMEFGLHENNSSWFVFFATVLAYNFIRLVQLNRIHTSVSIWIRSRSRALVLVNLICLVGLVYTAIQLNTRSLFLLLPFLMATGLYVYPGSGGFQGLRNLPGVKLLLISITWAGVTVLFPIEVSGLGLDGQVWIVFAQRLLFVMAITIPFDIRDLQLDDPELGTLPQSIGVLNSKLAALAALAAFCLIELIRTNLNLYKSLPALITALVAAALISGVSVHQKRFYSAFWVEAIPILWYGILILDSTELGS